MFRNISTALSTSGVALESDEFTASNGFTSTSAFSPKWKKAEDYMDGIFGGIELLSEASSEEDLIQQINGFEESVVMPAAQTEEDPKKHTAGWSAEQ